MKILSKKSLDKRGRWRNKVVAFRVSPEEDERIEIAVCLSGLTKQEYIIRRLQDQDIVVQGNPKVFKALKHELRAIQSELIRIQAGQTIDPGLQETIRLVTLTLSEMKGG